MKSPRAVFIQKPTSLVNLLRLRGTGSTNQRGYTFFRGDDVDDQWLRFEDLHLSAERVAAGLLEAAPTKRFHSHHTPARVIVLAPPSAAYLQAFFGILYAGMVVVTAYPPRARRRDERLDRVIQDSGATIALADASVFERRDILTKASPQLAELQWLNIDQLASQQTLSYHEIDVPSESLAVLQYTSGSTSDPKGVCLTHSNLIANLQMIYEAFELDTHEDLWGVSWLPPFHDMGLIGGLLQSIYAERSTHVIPPAAFVQKPSRWLRAITKYQAAISGGPNFAYDLCVDKIPPQQRESLDLSSWKLAFTGAEPIRKSTLDRFASAFAPSGFDKRSFYPCYGLAEATLLVSGGPRCREVKTFSPSDNSTVERTELVSCGRIASGMEVRIVDPQSRIECPEGTAGEVWLSGDNVSIGYWNQPNLNSQIFGQQIDGSDGSYLRTGDLGLLKDDELYITGRLKEMIVIRGRNFQPSEIEAIASGASASCVHNGCAAIEIAREDGTGLAIIQEIEPVKPKENNVHHYLEICHAVNEHIVEALDLKPLQICLIAKRSLPKTSSGKIMRLESKERLLQGDLEILFDSTKPIISSLSTAGSLSSSRAAVCSDKLTQWLTERLAAQLQCEPSAIDRNRPLTEYGLDSVSAVQIAGELESFLGESVSPTLFYDAPTIQAITYALRPSPVITGGKLDDDPSTSSETLTTPAQANARENVVIVGISCRLPGCDTPDQYWNLLRSGKSAITLPPLSRTQDLPEELRQTHGGWLTDIDKFDAELFGISPREASSIDPQHRLVLEAAWRAIEDARLDPRQLRGTKTGVFVGISNRDYERYLRDRKSQLSVYDMTGNAASMVAHRVSYHFDLVGPSLAIDTACSSSLVALHQAIRAIQAGDCELAIVAGVNLMLSPEVFQTLHDAQMLSPDHTCHTFDAKANGYVRGEGCAAILISSQSISNSWGLRKRAILCGSAINQDGLTAGITAPNGQSQVRLYQAALRDAKLSPEVIDLVEAHGTGTSLGDPIEFHSLNAVYGRPSSTPTRACFLGAVKSNLGHLEAAAGLTSLIKVVLQLERGTIVPQPNFQSPNPLINFHGSRLQIPQRPTPWIAQSARYAAVSSFGFGGTNAHIILRAPDEAPHGSADTPVKTSRTKDCLITLSAASHPALEQLASSHAQWIAKHPQVSPQLLSQSTIAQKSSGRFRLAFVDHQLTGIGSRLRRFGEGKVSSGIREGTQPANRETKIGFLFSGNQVPDSLCGSQLFHHEPTFQYWINCIGEYVAGQFRSGCLVSLTDKTHDTHIARKDLKDRFPDQYCETIRLFAIQYAIAKTLMQWGFKPSVVCGYGIGEYAAAAIADIFSWEFALRILFTHAEAVRHDSDHYLALVTLASIEKLSPILTECEHPPELRSIDSRDHLVFTGTESQIVSFKKRLLEANIHFRDVPDLHKILWMPPLVPQKRLRGLFEGTALNLPTCDFISSTTGTLANSEAASIDYWAHHLTSPIQFVGAMDSLATLDIDTSLEIGPGNSLSLLAALGQSEVGTIIPVLSNPQHEYSGLLSAVGELYVRGADLHTMGTLIPKPVDQISLPGHPFLGNRHWVETEVKAFHPQRSSDDTGGSCELIADTKGVIQSLTSSRHCNSKNHSDDSQAFGHTTLQTEVASYADSLDSLNHLIRLYIARALRVFVNSTEPGSLLEARTILVHPQLAPKHRNLIRRFLQILGDADGILKTRDRETDCWEVLRYPNTSDSILQAELSRIENAHPILSNELGLVSSCGDALPDILRGNLDPLQVLFPNGDSSALRRLYSESPVARAANQLVLEAIVAAIAARRKMSLDYPIRILEVGGGTGGTTRDLLTAVGPQVAEYRFTDASSLLVAQARGNLPSIAPLRFDIFDIELDPESQKIPIAYFDIVVAANVLHATNDLRRTLNHLQQCMTNGGFLIALEGIRRQPFLDLVFGITEGWWRFTDGDLRKDYPLLSIDSWKHLFHEQAFESADVVPYPNGLEAVGEDQAIFLAQTIRDVRSNPVAARSSKIPSTPVLSKDSAKLDSPSATLSAPNPWTQRFLEATGPSKKSSLEGYFLHTLDQVLQRNGKWIDLDAPVNTLGVDSLLAIQLQNRLRSDLGLSIPMVSFLQGSSTRQLLAAALESHPVVPGAQIAAGNTTVNDAGNRSAASTNAKELPQPHHLQIDPLLLDSPPESTTHQRVASAAALSIHPQHSSLLTTATPVTESTKAMSIGQQSLWFLYQRAPQSPAYNFAFAAKTQQKINVAALEKACDMLQRRHEALRTAYRWENDQPSRIVLSKTELSISIEDASNLEQSQILKVIRNEADKPFDLASGQVIRFRIYTRRDGDILSIVMHHIAADLWSMDLLIQELQSLYTQALRGERLELPPIEGDFDSYVQWENSLDTSDEGLKLWAFWETQLTGAPQVLQLPTSLPRPAEQTYEGASYQWTIDSKTETKLRELASAEKTTLYTVLLTAYQAFLARICQQDDLLVGTVSTTRLRSDWEGLVGYFLNHLVLRTQLVGSPSYIDLLRKTKEDLLRSLEHQAFPFAKLVERLRPHRDTSRSPLVQTMFIWDKPRTNRPPHGFDPAVSIQLDPILMEQRGAAFDITFIVFELENQLQITLRYNTALFDKEMVESLAESFQTFLGNVVSQPKANLRRIELISEKQKSSLSKWNDTTSAFDPSLTGYMIFHQWVQTSPDAIAIESSAGRFTYLQIARMVSSLADQLRRSGVTPYAKVAILMRRGVEPLIGILAIWKLGAAYLPLDPDHPTARLQAILDDAQPKALIISQDAEKQHRLKADGTRIELSLESLRALCEGLDPSQPSFQYAPESPAYVIYTSGSTGRPKGVVVPYRGLANLAVSQAELFEVQSSDRCLQFASLSFDASVFEMIMAFHAGATLVVLDSKTVRSTTSEIRSAIANAQISIATLPPTLLNAIPEDQLPSLRTLISAGEALSDELVRKWGTNRRLFNAYGPTETTVWATTQLCHPAHGKPSIGRPIPNTRIYITDKSLELLPLGVPGELCIAGVGLASRYHGLPELTASRFVPNPFDTDNDATLYRTGDLAKWNALGEIEFLGRIDSQIKIHGNRVETEEIASQLKHCDDVYEAYVKLDKSKSEPRIIAYVVPALNEPAQTLNANVHKSRIPLESELKAIDASALRQQLSATMPCYMLPAEFITIPQLPLTVNGKVDVEKLPSPSSVSDASAKKLLIDPATKTEKAIFDIWSKVLDRQDISVTDNFFDMGGASLSALQAAEMAREHGFAVTAEQLFQHQTIRELADALDRSTDDRQLALSELAPSQSEVPAPVAQVPVATSPLSSPESSIVEDGLSSSKSQPTLLRMGIESLGMYLPPKTATTTAVVEGCRHKLDFPLERMTGIEARHVAGETEFSIDLARRAAEDCLRHSNRKPEDIDLLIACNISRYDGPDFEISYEPSTAVRLKGMLGTIHAEAYDICNACAGFFTALLIAQSKLLSGEARYVMIVSGEYISHLSKTAQLEIEGFLDPRLACLTLGDAGVAMIVELRDDGTGFEALELFTKGQHHDLCIARETDRPHGGAIMYTDAIKASAVTLNYAVDHAAETLKKHGWKPDKIEHVIIHQTSSTTIDGAVEQLNRHFGPSIEAGVKAVNNLRFRGNTATTTHWVAVMDLIRQGRIHDGDQIVFAISGSGQTIGTALYKFDSLPSRLVKPAISNSVSKQITVNKPKSFGVKIAAASSVSPLDKASHDYSDFSVVELSARASQKALRKARWAKDCIELMIHAGVYRDCFLSEPAVAAILAGCLHVNTDEVTRTGNRTLAFDLSGGAVGPLAACSIVATMIRNGQISHGLVTAAEIENNPDGLPQRNVIPMGSAIALEAAPQGIGFGPFLLASYPEFKDDFRVFTIQGATRAELVIYQSNEWLGYVQHCLIKTLLRYLKEQVTTADHYQRILVVAPPGVDAEAISRELGVSRDRLMFPESLTKDPFTSGLAMLWEQTTNVSKPTAGDRWLLVSVGSGIEVACVEYRH